jgi:hypothetical protein
MGSPLGDLPVISERTKSPYDDAFSRIKKVPISFLAVHEMKHQACTIDYLCKCIVLYIGIILNKKYF